MKRYAPVFVLLIPFVSVLTGIALYCLATTHPDPEVRAADAPLSKTSWREQP